MTLPVDAIVPELLASLGRQRNFVLQAAPGAGKTTRVPLVLLRHGVLGDGTLLVTQPRRLAARMAADRVAASLGESPGGRVGYQVRFESAVGDRTRIVFLTEGLLARRLRDDPRLSGVGAVILDEFHERHLDVDVCLALLRRLQREHRPDLRIGVMSATIDADPVAAYLECDALHCPGRTHPVTIEHRDPRRDRALASEVAAAVRELCTPPPDGDILVFLPGAREIREAATACEPIARRHGIDLAVLHGDLPSAEQDRAVRPGPRPKLILSTNVAETSITIEGVVAVIDSGLHRRATHDPFTGISTLRLAKISQASAAQRAGRAGRVRPGRCLRLYTAHDLARRPAYDEPEIARLDLTGVALDLRAAGVDAPLDLQWLEPPPAQALEGADALLRRLQAIDAHGHLTDTGRAMLRFPVHPRLARLLVECERRRIPRLGAAAAALLSERPIVRASFGASQGASATASAQAGRAASDVVADIERLESIRRDGRRAAREQGLDEAACRQVERVRKQLEALVHGRRDDTPDPDDALAQALLTAFPDRVARVREVAGAPAELALAGGGSAILAPSSVVHGADFIVALAAREQEGRGGRTVVRSAAAIEPAWLLDLFPDAIEEHREITFAPNTERVQAFDELRYEGLVIDRTQLRDLPPEAAAVLYEAAVARGPGSFVDHPERLEQLVLRTRFAAAHAPEIQPLRDDDVREVLAASCEGRRSLAELRSADLVAQVQARLQGDGHRLDRIAPTHVTLPGGRRLPVHYEPDRPPWIASRLQDFFGTTEGPRVAEGRVPLVLHLLAPNGRPVQVTTDLAGFWERHYPALRRELMRRYPKHAWPEDPTTAAPPSPRPRRAR